MKHFLSLILLTMIPVASVAQPSSWNLMTSQQQDSINRFCSEYLHIPYGTDNLNDLDWLRMYDCREVTSDNVILGQPIPVR